MKPRHVVGAAAILFLILAVAQSENRTPQTFKSTPLLRFRPASSGRSIQFRCGGELDISACMDATTRVTFSREWEGVEVCFDGECTTFKRRGK